MSHNAGGYGNNFGTTRLALTRILPRHGRNLLPRPRTRNNIHHLYNPSGSEPPLIEGTNLIGVPFELNSSADPYSDLDTSATASNRLLFVGDWKQYVILDRVGTSVYFLPPGVLTNTAANLPDGRVGWFAVWRTEAEPLTISALRMLDVETAS